MLASVVVWRRERRQKVIERKGNIGSTGDAQYGSQRCRTEIAIWDLSLLCEALCSCFQCEILLKLSVY